MLELHPSNSFRENRCWSRCQTPRSKEFKQCRPFQIYQLQSTLGFSRCSKCWLVDLKRPAYCLNSFDRGVWHRSYWKSCICDFSIDFLFYLTFSNTMFVNKYLRYCYQGRDSRMIFFQPIKNFVFFSLFLILLLILTQKFTTRCCSTRSRWHQMAHEDASQN